ncbi:Cysteine synthase CysK [Helicobacter ailurogastricus]|uniref:Cysteine synthase n=1 Tax=Helicobacter ailurogastricus TaxID=1578720 RepID=A0A0K2Y635_9HELI|nr:cysteine synthase A [Helicobacter ailurogastricus]BDQ28935.1 cysteine synthase [Helicobacter ailurogastricus]GMB89995.1 Cysteine synthase CysK [Helicobacter ailurogastricus]GMB91555.1 Cysteine synthase CysK [Helicobacter ailurogastricus]CRI32443.1 Cysteine synthase [Helicobacter ailurogastricus]
MIYSSALELIGNTPILKTSKLLEVGAGDLFVKLEKFNPGGSVKDRAAWGMIEQAEKDGRLIKGMTIVEPTSGNTGIALALIGLLKGYKVIIVMPDTMSIERRELIRAYGAELVLTPGSQGTKGAIDKALEIGAAPGHFIPQQFENPANPNKHYCTTAEEILWDLPDLDALVLGVGTGGTIAGVGRKFKESKHKAQIIAVEPAQSSILSGGAHSPHKIQGIGVGFVPANYDKSVVDEVIAVDERDAIHTARLFGQKEGILVGISSGAAIFAAMQVARRLGQGKSVLTLAADGGEKYISTGLYDDGSHL